MHLLRSLGLVLSLGLTAFGSAHGQVQPTEPVAALAPGQAMVEEPAPEASSSPAIGVDPVQLQPSAPYRPWTFTVAPYVLHWRHDPEHKYAFVFALEHRLDGNDFGGLALFRNSFGQPSGYIYLGRRWDHIYGNPDLSFKLTAGVIYGYVGDHKDKVPFNWNGYSPTIIPSLVYQFTPQDSFDVMMLGTAGLVFGYSRTY